MLKRFKIFTFSNLTWIFILLILFWVLHFFNDNQSYHETFSIIGFWFNSTNKVLSIILSILLVIANVFMLLLITQKFEIFPNNSLIPIVIFVLLSAYIPGQVFSSILLSNIFILYALYIVLKSMSTNKSLLLYLNVSIIAFIAGLIYYPHFAFFFILLIIILVIRSGVNKELLVVFFSFILLSLIFMELFYLIKGNVFDISSFMKGFVNRGDSITLKLHDKIFMGILLFYIVLSALFLIANVNQREIRIRTIFSIFLLLFVYSVLLAFIPSAYKSIWQFMIIPASFLIGYYFQFAKESKLNRLLFNLLFILPFLYQLAVIFNF